MSSGRVHTERHGIRTISQVLARHGFGTSQVVSLMSDALDGKTRQWTDSVSAYTLSYHPVLDMFTIMEVRNA